MLVVLQACRPYNGRIRQIHFPFTMNSGTTSTELNDMLTDFVDYVDSFYGLSDPIYPMTYKDTGLPLTKYDIYGATEDYLSKCSDDSEKLCVWGDGDSLDRERVRDILLADYNLEIKEWN